MALLETWRNLAYGNGLNDKEKEKLWNGYFTIEKGIYEQILSEPTQVITGTVKELAEKYRRTGTDFVNGRRNMSAEGNGILRQQTGVLQFKHKCCHGK